MNIINYSSESEICDSLSDFKPTQNYCLLTIPTNKNRLVWAHIDIVNLFIDPDIFIPSLIR